jgi:uncharacterized membrane protein YfcA
MSQDIVFYMVVVLAAFIIGLAKGGLGGMLGALATPLMALVLPVDQVIGLILPMLILADIFSIVFYWRKWDRRRALRMLPMAVVGVVLATLFIKNAPTRLVEIGLGVLVLLFTAYKLFEKQILTRVRYVEREWHGYTAGGVAGFASALAHNGGPPVTIYLLMQPDMTPVLFNGTCALFFTVLNWVKVPFYWASGLFAWARLVQLAWVAPVIPLGVWVGISLARRINQQLFEWVIIALLALTGVLLIVG